jgi:3-oxoacyl-[acyl-carrier-protein] synthase II
MIARGEADAVLAGGADSMVTPAGLRAWHMTGALAGADTVDPARSCKPFDARRTGFAMGEGAAALVLENAEAAERRGANILGYVCGFGHGTDVAHISRPSSPSQVAAMRAALDDAGLAADRIDYLNAHGTATALGDQVEAESIREVFGNHALRMPVGSTKAMHGHTLGAAGALEAIVCLVSLWRRLVPPNPHLDAVDANTPSLCLPRAAIALNGAAVVHALSNSFAFGGVNASLVFASP